MKCLPYGGRIEKYDDGIYFWFDKNVKVHSFNDQPSYVLINASRKCYEWANHGKWAYRYGKPIDLEIVYEDVVRVCVRSDRTKSYSLLDIDEVHLDYKDIYKNYCANMESKN